MAGWTQPSARRLRRLKLPGGSNPDGDGGAFRREIGICLQHQFAFVSVVVLGKGFFCEGERDEIVR